MLKQRRFSGRVDAHIGENKMSTSAQAVISKNDQATQLREQSRRLAAELVDLRAKFAHASGALTVLEEKRRVIAEEIADGKAQKSGSADIHAKIADAKLPVEVLQKRVSEKESALNQTRSALETIEYELKIQAQQVARKARFDMLATDLEEAAARIGGILHALVAVDLPAFDGARQALTAEFISQPGADPANAEGREARELIHRVEAGFRDGSYLKVERELLRAGFVDAGETGLSFLVKTLRPPRN
jgi:hypothetical protein